MVAEPLETVAIPRDIPLSKNSTVPVSPDGLESIVPVKMRFVLKQAGLAEDETVILVFVGVTVNVPFTE